MKKSPSARRFKIADILSELRVSLAATLSLAILCCCVYPLAVWTLAQGMFPQKANGSLIHRNGEIAGSSLLAQNFTGPGYFHSRPSAAGEGYDAIQSGGSNLGPISRNLIHTVAERVRQYRDENGLSVNTPVPVDAVTASGSGLDPHISIQNALLQARRVAQARGISEKTVREKIAAHTQGRDFGILGEPRVNVMELNMDLAEKGEL